MSIRFLADPHLDGIVCFLYVPAIVAAAGVRRILHMADAGNGWRFTLRLPAGLMDDSGLHRRKAFVRASFGSMTCREAREIGEVVVHRPGKAALHEVGFRRDGGCPEVVPEDRTSVWRGGPVFQTTSVEVAGKPTMHEF